MDDIIVLFDRIRGQIIVPTEGWVNNWNQKRERIQRRVPSDEELVNSWWRTRTLNFIKKYIEINGQKRIEKHEWTLEDRLWKRYPHLETDWINHRLQLAHSVPSIEVLKKRWSRKRRQTFFKEQSGIQSNVYLKKYFRFDRFLSRIVWCNHSQCSTLRLSLLFWLILHLIVIWFAFY